MLCIFDERIFQKTMTAGIAVWLQSLYSCKLIASVPQHKSSLATRKLLLRGAGRVEPGRNAGSGCVSGHSPSLAPHEPIV
jgi:hypothetical protein